MVHKNAPVLFDTRTCYSRIWVISIQLLQCQTHKWLLCLIEKSYLLENKSEIYLLAILLEMKCYLEQPLNANSFVNKIFIAESGAAM